MSQLGGNNHLTLGKVRENVTNRQCSFLVTHMQKVIIFRDKCTNKLTHWHYRRKHLKPHLEGRAESEHKRNKQTNAKSAHFFHSSHAKKVTF